MNLSIDLDKYFGFISAMDHVTGSKDALCTMEIAPEEVGAKDRSGSQVEAGKIVCSLDVQLVTVANRVIKVRQR